MGDRPERPNQNGESVSRWNPSRELSPNGRDRFDRLFRLSGMFDDATADSRHFPGAAPCIDIDEDEESYEVTAELPGMKPEDVQVELDQNVLTISGEKRLGLRDEVRPKRRNRWSERSYGRFTRSFELPGDADADRMRARFSRGVLTISIPKSEEAKRRTIEVKAAS